MGFKDHHHTDETKKLMSELGKERSQSEESKRLMSEAKKQWHADHPEETQQVIDKIAQMRREGQFEVTEETRNKLSEANKRIFQDPNERKKRGRPWTEERKQEMAEKRKALWQDPEYREKTLAARRGKKRGPSEAISKAATERWADPEFKEKMIPISQAAAQQRDTAGEKNGMYGRTHTEESRNNISTNLKKHIQEHPEHYEHQVKASKLGSAASKLLWDTDEDFRKRVLYKLKTIARPTSIEIAVKSVLDALGIKNEPEKAIGRYPVDFYLPDYNMVIECDGDYWHSLPKSIERDARKDKYLTAHGYKVVRLREKDINTDVENLVSSLFDLY